MPGIGDLDPDELPPTTPPFGAHQVLYDVLDDAIGPQFRRGPNNERSDKRRDDFLIGFALFIDVPQEEDEKTRLYFAASMIAEAPNRNVHTQNAPLQNMTSIVDGDRLDDGKNKIDAIAEGFTHLEEQVEEQIAGTETTKAEVVEETLEGVRIGQSFFARWGDARAELKQRARESGRGKFGQ